MVYFVGTPIGNLEDLSPRGRRVLEEGEVVLAEDTRVAKKLYSLLKIPIAGREFISFYEENAHRRLQELSPELLRERRVVYISDAGMPGISDPGYQLVQFCQREQVPYTVVPGPSAVTTALLASGFSGEFKFYGFLPRKGQERARKLEEVLGEGCIGVIFEAPHRLRGLLEELESRAPDRLIFLGKELTKKFEQYYWGTPRQLLEQIGEPKGEWVVVVSPGAQSRRKGVPAEVVEEIWELPIPPKRKAKLLSKLTGEPVKELYTRLTK